jgi:hypothetical protein
MVESQSAELKAHREEGAKKEKMWKAALKSIQERLVEEKAAAVAEVEAKWQKKLQQVESSSSE